MIAEQAHERGREGALRAKRFLEARIGGRIDLPWNAYDHRARLSFEDHTTDPPSSFVYDLGGHLRRRDDKKFGGDLVLPLLVEVKHYTSSSSLLEQFRDFIRHAGVVSEREDYCDARFVFVSTVPFGCSEAAALCNGQLAGEVLQKYKWRRSLTADAIHRRMHLVFLNQSFNEFIEEWCHERPVGSR